MKFKVDHDLHIHSNLSWCSQDENQTPERILKYAEQNGFNKVCLTNHFWDERVEGASNWYLKQNFEHISEAKPLPQSDKVQFLFGCETDLRQDLLLGISKERFDDFDFVVIPTTHLHMMGFTITEQEGATFKGRADAWVRRLDSVLSMDIPFHKIGIAHLTCGLIAPERPQRLEVLKEISEKEMERLFKQAAKAGVGIELNAHDIMVEGEDVEFALLPYRIAKACGCKFYCASDAHVERHFNNVKSTLEKTVDLLGLTEEDKFIV